MLLGGGRRGLGGGAGGRPNVLLLEVVDLLLQVVGLREPLPDARLRPLRQVLVVPDGPPVGGLHLGVHRRVDDGVDDDLVGAVLRAHDLHEEGRGRLGDPGPSLGPELAERFPQVAGDDTLEAGALVLGVRAPEHGTRGIDDEPPLVGLAAVEHEAALPQEGTRRGDELHLDDRREEVALEPALQPADHGPLRHGLLHRVLARPLAVGRDEEGGELLGLLSFLDPVGVEHPLGRRLAHDRFAIPELQVRGHTLLAVAPVERSRKTYTSVHAG